MSTLILGATGMFGQSILKEARKRKIEVYGVARGNTDIVCDILDDGSLNNIFLEYNPSLVINAAALVNIDECESNINAWNLNARAVAVLAKLCKEYEVKLVHISTDHYFTGDKNKKHSENDSVEFVNDYARQKYAAEQFSLTMKNALVLRLNIVGFRGWKLPTFVEWAFKLITEDGCAELFEDFYTSSIDVNTASSILFDLVDKNANGIFNVASSEVFSKKEFFEKLALGLNKELTKTKSGSVHSCGIVTRAESLGLDVSKAEKVLGYYLPSLDEVISVLIQEYRERS